MRLPTSIRFRRSEDAFPTLTLSSFPAARAKPTGISSPKSPKEEHMMEDSDSESDLSDWDSEDEDDEDLSGICPGVPRKGVEPPEHHQPSSLPVTSSVLSTISSTATSSATLSTTSAVTTAIATTTSKAGSATSAASTLSSLVTSVAATSAAAGTHVLSSIVASASATDSSDGRPPRKSNNAAAAGIAVGATAGVVFVASAAFFLMRLRMRKKEAESSEAGSTTSDPPSGPTRSPFNTTNNVARSFPMPPPSPNPFTDPVNTAPQMQMSSTDRRVMTNSEMLDNVIAAVYREQESAGTFGMDYETTRPEDEGYAIDDASPISMSRDLTGLAPAPAPAPQMAPYPDDAVSSAQDSSVMQWMGDMPTPLPASPTAGNPFEDEFRVPPSVFVGEDRESFYSEIARPTVPTPWGYQASDEQQVPQNNAGFL